MIVTGWIHTWGDLGYLVFSLLNFAGVMLLGLPSVYSMGILGIGISLLGVDGAGRRAAPARVPGAATRHADGLPARRLVVIPQPDGPGLAGGVEGAARVRF